MATSGNDARGLVPVRRQDGQPPGVMNKYPTGSNTDILMLGDPVYLDVNSKLQRFQGAITTANAPAVLGVVGALYNSAGRPLTHEAEKKIGVSASAYVGVWDDPDLLFEIECSASLSFPSRIAEFGTVVSGTRTTANGNSGVRLADLPVNTAAGHPFQIYGLAPVEVDGVGGVNNNVLVRISNHVFRRSTRVQGPLEAADA